MSEKSVCQLAGAVVLQAIEDAGSGSVGRRKRALEGMNSKDNGCFSVAFLCCVLNRDPAEVRSFCQRQAAEHPREAPFCVVLRDPKAG